MGKVKSFKRTLNFALLLEGLGIISPFEIKKDYEIKLSNEIIEALNIQNQKDVLLYSIVKLDSKIENITANLKAPLVININSKKGNNIY